MPASRFQFDLVANVGKFRRGFRAADRAVRGLGDRLSYLKSGLVAAGGALAAFFGGRALVRGFQAIVGEAATLESAMAGVQAATGAADEEIAQLRETAVDLGRKTKFTADQAAGAMENLGRAGLTTEENLQAIPKVIDLAVASGGNLAQTASIVTGTVRGMGLEFSETGRVVDVLTAASQSANTTVQGLGQAMSQAAPLARNLGLSVEETSALIGTLANNNIDASRAGTALRKIFVDLDNPMSTFSRALSNAGIESRNLFEVLEQLKRGGPGVEAAINGIGNEAIASLRVLVREADGDLAGLVEQMRNAQGASSEAASVIRDTFNNAMDRLVSAWNTAKRALGEPILDTVRDSVERLQTEIGKLADSGKLQSIGETIADTFRKGEKAVRDFLSRWTVEDAIGSTKSAIKGLGDAFQRTGAAISAVGNAIGTVWNTVQGTVGIAVGLVIKSIAKLMGHLASGAEIMERFGLVSESAADRMRLHADAMNHAGNETLRYAKESLQKAWEQSKAVAGATDDLGSSHEEAARKAREHGEAEVEAAEKAEKATASYEELARITERVSDALAADSQAEVEKAQQTAKVLQEQAAAAKRRLEIAKNSADATEDQVQRAKASYKELQRAADNAVKRAEAAEKARTEATQEALREQYESEKAKLESLRSALEAARSEHSSSFLSGNDDFVQQRQAAIDTLVEQVRYAEAEVRVAAEKTADAQEIVAGRTEAALQQRQQAAQQAAADAKTNLESLRRSSSATQDEIFAASKAYQQAQARAARATEALAGESEKAQSEAEQLKAAMESLGVETQASLEEAAASAKQAFEQVMESGSPEEIERAFKAYADKAIAANDGAANSYVKATAKALGLQDAIEGVGDAADQSGDKAAQSADKAGDAAADAAKQAGEASEEAIDGSRRAAQGLAAIITGLRDKYRAVGEGALESFDKLNHKAADGLSTMRGYLSDLADARDRLDQQVAAEREALASMQQTIEASSGSTENLSQIASMTTDQFELLGEQKLSGVRSAIQQAKDDLDAMRGSAEDTLGSLNEELLELQGRETELARSRNQSRRRDIEGQLAEAQAAGDGQSVRRLYQALERLDQISTIEQRRAAQKEQQARAGNASANNAQPATRRIELRGPDGATATVQADDENAEQLLDTLQKAGLRTQ